MAYRLSKIYTRTGDDGTTSVEPKKRIAKNSARIEALGALDELNCSIGLILANPISDKTIQDVLTSIQQDLFNLGAELCPPHHTFITEEKILFLEKMIDQWNETLPPLKEFILPRGNFLVAHTHLARAICRRAERNLVSLHQEKPVSIYCLQYLNRLSDWLFVLARVLMKDQKEILWEHERK